MSGRIWMLAAVCVLAFAGTVACGGQTPFEFTLPKDCVTGAGVYGPDGQLVRVLWSAKPLPGGKHAESWDGLDDFGLNVPPGPYEVRVACSNASYFSLGTIGNSGVGKPMQSGTDDLFIDRKTGEIYTANNWEEAGQDFRKMDANGVHLMDAEFRVRNGNPNGWPIALTVQDGVMYCSVFASGDMIGTPPKRMAGGIVIRKFTADKGEPLKFPTDTGYIRVRYPDPNDDKPFNHQSVHSIAICGDAIVVADRWKGKVQKFDKTSGRPIGEFSVPDLWSMVADEANRLWIAHARNKLMIADLDGKVLAQPEVGAKDIACIRLAPGNQLWVADQDAGAIQVYKIDSLDKLSLVKSFGHKARNNPLDALAIGHIQTFDVMADGGFVMAQTFGHGSIVTRFTADGKVVWQQVGLEFCTNGTYDRQRPDLFISSPGNAYRLLDLAKGAWEFAGAISGGGALGARACTGTPRIIHLEGHAYYCCPNGMDVKIFHLDDNRLKIATMVGLSDRAWIPEQMGPLPASPSGKGIQFCWSDTHGDGNIRPQEVVVSHGPRIGGYSSEVDARGNIFFPNHMDKAVWELPLDRLDAAGNPVYDFSKLRQVIPPDDSILGLFTMKVVPIPNGWLALQSADTSLFSVTHYSGGWGYCWMGGGVLSRYDLQGRRLWSVALGDQCTGLDWVPAADANVVAGIVAGQFTAKNLYHYSPDGLLLGAMTPKHVTGWLDHNGSISICRNPTDGLADVFAEESLCNRISWYRMDDRSLATIRLTVAKAPVAGETYSSQKEFEDSYRSGLAKARQHAYAEAAELLAKALDGAGPREKLIVQLALGNTLIGAGKIADGIAHLQAVVDSNDFDPHKRAECAFQINLAYRRLKDYPHALAALAPIAKLPVANEHGYRQRVTAETARTDLDANDFDAALKAAREVLAFYKDAAHEFNGGIFTEAVVAAATAQAHLGKIDDAVDQLHQAEQTPALAQDGKVSCCKTEADLLRQARQFEKAGQCCRQAVARYPKMSLENKCELLMSGGDSYREAGNLPAARECWQAILDLNPAPAGPAREAQNRLAALDKQSAPPATKPALAP